MVTFAKSGSPEKGHTEVNSSVVETISMFLPDSVVAYSYSKHSKQVLSIASGPLNERVFP